MGRNYTYEAARVRAAEARLLTEEDYRRLEGEQSEQGLVRQLKDKGLGGADAETARELLRAEEEQLQRSAREMLGTGLVYRVFCLSQVYEQLKLELKQNYCSLTERTVKGFITESMKQRFPFWTEAMERAAAEAMQVLLETGNAQQFDMILDQAAYGELAAAARETRITALITYTKRKTETANLRIALRSAAMGKPAGFLQEALIQQKGPGSFTLAEQAAKGTDTLLAYLEKNGWQEAAAAWKQSPSDFEQWCQTYEKAGLQQTRQWEPFGVVMGYLLKKQEEIRRLRRIAGALTWKPASVQI